MTRTISAHLSSSELDEIVYGLSNSAHSYKKRSFSRLIFALTAVRSIPTVAAPPGTWGPKDHKTCSAVLDPNICTYGHKTWTSVRNRLPIPVTPRGED